MESLKYKVIKNKKQYNDYCHQLEELIDKRIKSKALNEEIELLTLLIEKWDSEHNLLSELDPVQLLNSLMNDRGMKPVSLAQELGVSKGLVSDVLNYKKGFSKEMIRKLSETFKLSQEAFNRRYNLIETKKVNPVKASTSRKHELVFG
ncbi:MAG: transcriptional regulator [Bacteroidetes bacterium]|nr:transcriptional regulator [Bacteroidota bacterium]